MKNLNEIVPIYRFETLIERDALLAMFKEKNISEAVRLFEDSAYDSIYRPQYGLGEILIKKEDIEKAKRVIKEFKLVNKQNIEGVDDKKWKEDLLKRNKRNSKVSGIILVSFFFILGIFVFFYSPVKVVSIVPLVLSLFFLKILYMSQKQ